MPDGYRDEQCLHSWRYEPARFDPVLGQSGQADRLLNQIPRDRDNSDDDAEKAALSGVAPDAERCDNGGEQIDRQGDLQRSCAGSGARVSPGLQ